MKREEIQQSLIDIAGIHAERLKLASARIKHLLPFSPDNVAHMTPEHLADTDFFSNRFCKLQDLIGTKILPILLEKHQVNIDRKTPIDILNLAEKYEFIDSRIEWNKLRDIRNHLTHEYPHNPALTAEYLNQAVEASSRLLQIWQNIKKQLEEHK
mgnify:CR=1 FL=1